MLHQPFNKEPASPEWGAGTRKIIILLIRCLLLGCFGDLEAGIYLLLLPSKWT